MNQVRAFRETLTAFKDDLRQQLTSAYSLILLGVYLLFNLMMTVPYVFLAKKAGEGLARSGSGASITLNLGKHEGLTQLFLRDTADPVEAMAMANMPASALYTFLVAALAVLLLAALFNADMLAEDLRTGHIRYLALRCGRGSLLAGRTLSRALLLGATVLATTMASFLVYQWKLADLPLGSLVHFLRLGGLLAAMAAAATGLAALCSTLVRSPMLAVVLTLLAVLGLAIAGRSDAVSWATPIHYLLHFGPSRLPLGILAYLAFGVAFGAMAWLRLHTRDL